MPSFSVDIKFDDSYFKKLGLKNHDGYEDVLDRALEHTLHDAENISRREAPIDTGNLRRGISKHHPRKCEGAIISRAPYWVYLQYGTSKMSPNPFVTRTARKVGPRFTKYIREEFKNKGIIE